MTFIANQLPLSELHLRHEKCRKLLQKHMPNASGLLVFSRTNIYYLSGSRANGMLWLPREGNPVLMVRKGEDRCRLESPLSNIATFKSYSNIPDICAEFNVPLGSCVAAEMRALPWSLAQMLMERLKHIEFTSGDEILNQARFIKTEFERNLLHKSDALHLQALQEELVTSDQHNYQLSQSKQQICVGMKESEIAHNIWHRFFALGHGGMLRMHEHGQEVFLGKVAVGKNALYPSPFNGAMGVKGQHPCIPFMGYAGSTWNEQQLLLLDTAFIYEGYHSATTTTYWAGTSNNIPTSIKNAHACCLEILIDVQENLQKGLTGNECITQAQNMAKKHGFAEGFMGLKDNKSLILAYGIGLTLDECEVVSTVDTHYLYEFSAGAVFNINAMIALPEYGMVGIRHTFELINNTVKAFPGLESKQDIVCFE